MKSPVLAKKFIFYFANNIIPPNANTYWILIDISKQYIYPQLILPISSLNLRYTANMQQYSKNVNASIFIHKTYISDRTWKRELIFWDFISNYISPVLGILLLLLLCASVSALWIVLHQVLQLINLLLWGRIFLIFIIEILLILIALFIWIILITLIVFVTLIILILLMSWFIFKRRLLWLLNN